ncbi:hypothetical protein [Paenibacillus qinlingensis]|uniref:Peptidase M14 carboxypeptidase A domain-containing protein n=1 Tax=Paenibacillus qinlingensis TaxID=1837343 RepID=A0ABU1NRH0_9BACL|nr:hypothetical protein [Paenibacillus qinlingensis]MDR6550075.1 hypothetical protein [Paenibacillus qinlingensis]
MIPFIAKAEQLEQKIKEWETLAGSNMVLDHLIAYSGHKVYAITISDFTVPRTKKKALYISQPHAHEPGTTAGMVDVIEQLLTGKDLLGNPCQFDREKVLANTIITFNPDGNPFGRANSPELYYDGTKYTPKQFQCLIFGEDPDNPGERWKRVDLWDRRDENAPNPIGIVYEPIDEFRYVEPNRSQLSSYFKLFYQMDDQYQYEYWLDLHQMMFLGQGEQDSGSTCQIFMPLPDLVVSPHGDENLAWAAEITQDWLDNGFAAKAPISTPYTDIQAEYFRRNFREIHKRMSRISTEVITNRAQYPVEIQVKAQSSAIETTLKRLLAKNVEA